MILFPMLIICEHRSTSIDAPIFTILFNFFTSQKHLHCVTDSPNCVRHTSTKTYNCVAL